MKPNVKSHKAYIKLNDIVVPQMFVSKPPGLDKVLKHHECYLNDGCLDPVIIDANNVIIDGYISYLIHRHYGHKEIMVYRITILKEKDNATD